MTCWSISDGIDLAGKGESFHLARVHFPPSRLSNLHTHDFPEIFWIETGTARHAINDTLEILAPGDLVFIRAADRHKFRAEESAGFTMVNIAFAARTLRELVARYPEARALHGPGATFPARRKLTRPQMQHLREEVRRLIGSERRRILGERFLLGLYVMGTTLNPPARTVLPEWLERACSEMARPEHFSAGFPAFVRLCGRHPAYVARSCRRLLRFSPTEFINGIRMEHAARELRLGPKPILDIALECGCGNLAHFYALFRAAHAQTPRQYRLAFQSTVH